MAQSILNYLTSMDLWDWIIVIICLVTAFYIFVLARRKIREKKVTKAKK